MAGKVGQGTVVEWGDGADPEVFTAIPNVTNISPPSASREIYDVTAHDSPTNAAGYISKEKIFSAIVDEGQLEMDFYYDESEHEALRPLLGETQPTAWRITLTSGTTLEFDGGLMDLSADIPFDGPQEGSMTVEVSGPVTVTTV